MQVLPLGYQEWKYIKVSLLAKCFAFENTEIAFVISPSLATPFAISETPCQSLAEAFSVPTSTVSCSSISPLLIFPSHPQFHIEFVSRSPPPTTQSHLERWSLVYFTRPGNDVRLRALTDESAIIAEAVEKSGAMADTGSTAGDWFARRIKNQRIKNRTVRFLTYSWV